MLGGSPGKSCTMPRMPTVAAIDVGSNATRLSTVSVSPAGIASGSEFHRYPVRLGADVFQDGTVGPTRAAALLTAFHEMAGILRDRHIDRYRAVATSAMRDARNGASLVQQIRAQTGLEVEIISGVEESELARQALVRALGSVPADAVLIDLGGGSLEVERASGPAGQSLPLGSVRLLEHYPSLLKPVPPEIFQTIRAEVAAILRDRLGPAVRAPLAIGTGGNLDVLAQLLAQPGTHLPAIDVTQLEPFTHAVAAMTVEERMRCYGVRPDRADLILPAVIIIAALVQHFSLPTLVVPGTGLREAILHRLVTPDGAGRDRARDLVARLHGGMPAADAAARIATELFAALAPLHGLWPPALLPLQAAVYAWHAGACIEPAAAGQHGAYLIRAVAGLELDPGAVSLGAWALGAVTGAAADEVPGLDAAEQHAALALAGILQQSLALAPCVPRRGRLHVDVLAHAVTVRAKLTRPLPDGASLLLAQALGRPVVVI